jgi:hypothetical protein
MNLNTKIEWIKTQLQLPSCSETTLSLSPLDFDFFHIQEITYEDESPRREAFENVLGSLRLEGINFVYLLLGNKKGISFYFGVAKNRKQLEVDIDDIANQILRANIEGNFRGSKVERLRKAAKLELQNRLQKFSYVPQVSGVPELNEEAEQFQGIDRLVDIMFKDEFVLMITSSAMSLDEIEIIEQALYSIHDKMSPLVKKMVQKTYSKAESNTESKAKTHAIAKSKQESESVSESDNHSSNTTKSTSNTNSESKNDSESESNSSGSSTNNSHNESDSNSETDTTSYSNTTTTSTSNTTNDSGSSKSTSKGSSEQDSKNTQKSSTKSKTKSSQTSETTSTSTQFTKVKSKNKNQQQSKSESQSTSTQEAKSTQKGTSNSESISDTDSETNSYNYMENKVENETINIEIAKKELEDWLSYIDKQIKSPITKSTNCWLVTHNNYYFDDFESSI